MTEQRRSPVALQPGTMPPVLVERQSFINDFAYALDGGHGAMGRSTLVTGESGMGKSTMLTVFEEVATSRSWATVHLPDGAGPAERLAEAQIPRLLDDEAVHGVLITVDDIDRAPLWDLEQVAGTVADAIPYQARSARVGLERLSDDGVREVVSASTADIEKTITEAAVDVWPSPTWRGSTAGTVRRSLRKTFVPPCPRVLVRAPAAARSDSRCSRRGR